MKKKAYLFFDTEYDGIDIVKNSLRSMGSVLTDETGEHVIDEFYFTIEPIKHTSVSLKQQHFFKEHQKAWNELGQNNISPKQAMQQISDFYTKWSNTHNIIWVCDSVCTDWMWLKSYYANYGPDNKTCIGWYCMDMNERFSGLCIANNWAVGLFIGTLENPKFPKTHNALDDAKHLQHVYVNYYKYISICRSNKQTK